MLFRSWTTGANGIATVTGNTRTPSPDYIHGLVKRWEETDPSTPGWSVQDLDLAVTRFGQPFTDRTHSGWAALLEALNTQHYVALQGDSDRFGNSTCSGAFNGNHMIGINPLRRVVDRIAFRWINDPICPTGRWERESVIHAYGAKLDPNLRFGYFNTRVPSVGDGEWVWRFDPPGRDDFATFHVVNGVIAGSPNRITTAATALYHASAPRTYPWPGHESQSLVLLGKRVDGRAGPLVGSYVQARYARRTS